MYVARGRLRHYHSNVPTASSDSFVSRKSINTCIELRSKHSLLSTMYTHKNCKVTSNVGIQTKMIIYLSLQSSQEGNKIHFPLNGKYRNPCTAMQVNAAREIHSSHLSIMSSPMYCLQLYYHYTGRGRIWPKHFCVFK